MRCVAKDNLYATVQWQEQFQSNTKYLCIKIACTFLVTFTVQETYVTHNWRRLVVEIKGAQLIHNLLSSRVFFVSSNMIALQFKETL